MVQSLARSGIGFMFIMPGHLLRCHPFVGSSHFILERNDLEDDAYEESPATDCSIEKLSTTLGPGVLDRDARFFIDDSPGRGPLTRIRRRPVRIQSLPHVIL